MCSIYRIDCFGIIAVVYTVIVIALPLVCYAAASIYNLIKIKLQLKLTEDRSAVHDDNLRAGPK